MEEKLDFDELNSLFNRAVHIHGGKPKSRFFSLVTVENFIYHLPKIKDRRKKMLAYKNLREFLNIILAVSENEAIDYRTGDELFTKYLQPIAHEYKVRHGFIPMAKPWIPILFLLCIEVFAYSLDASKRIHISVIIVFALFYLIGRIKQRQKKVYGLFI